MYHAKVTLLIFGTFLSVPSAFAIYSHVVTAVPEYYYALQEYAPTFDNYVPADYTFEYSVSDPISGDHKSQWEHKKNGTVRGVYTFLEADGTTRYVEYVADKHGFRANVKRIGTPEGNNVVIDHSKKLELVKEYSPLAFDDVDILVKSYNFGEETEVHGLTGNEEDDSLYTV
ncbi:cuticle protein 19-like [Agrilus planipennis]|uniref:Cuticle protein 19-like n=1 Tax=Agrilus planipennis TaxID=224129 RepID=A0A1W4WRU1_AGRPL|nr:cuticle protein 19-like [Agrilus planipennis]